MQRVLVVDDEHLIRSSLCKKITELGPQFIVSGTAENGKEALEWLETYYADICVTDVSMPLMNGLDLIELVKRRFPWMHCVIVSSYDDFNYVRQALQHGAIDYILKPIEQETLAEAMLKAADRLRREREDRARKLLLQHLPHHRKLLEHWVTRMKLGELSNLPLLVVETLETLEMWTEECLDLLMSLSFGWLEIVAEELSRDRIEVQLEEGEDIGLGDALIAKGKLRFYFRLCAVRRLEEGAAAVYRACKASQDQPTRKALEDAKQYIRANYATKLSLQEIAEQATMSRSYFANVFKQETGMTVWNYITSVRMDEARKLLMQSPMKMYEIAKEVGYENSVYFTQTFKEYYGLTPAEYKKRMEA
jgi:two-component system response regulator YesN